MPLTKRKGLGLLLSSLQVELRNRFQTGQATCGIRRVKFRLFLQSIPKNCLLVG